MLEITNTGMIIGSSIVVFLFIIFSIFYIIYKDKKRDEEEINDIISNLVDLKPIQEVKGAVTEVKPTEIEEMLAKMQKDLETKPDEIVANFEQEQEEKSIISYQELIKNKTSNKKNSKIETKKLPELITKIEEPVEQIRETIKPVIETDDFKKFKKTEFLSPVYGKMNEHLEYPTVPSFETKQQLHFDFDEYFKDEYNNQNIEEYLGEFTFENNIEINSLEQTLDMPPISLDIKKNEDFLQALKEFRNNL